MRDTPRIHVDDPLEAGARVVLDSERQHYLLNVMRASAGDAVRLFNAQAGEWTGRLTGAPRNTVNVLVEERCRPPAVMSEPGLTLLFAPLKRDATDLAVRMATEIGVSRIVPVATARTIAGRVNLDRLHLIAREAAEQCERLDVPAIQPLISLHDMLDRWPPAQTIVAALERSGARKLGRPAPPPSASATAILVGPEGGFTPAELDALHRRPFVEPVSIGSTVLRAETACAVGLALLLSERLGCDVEPG